MSSNLSCNDAQSHTILKGGEKHLLHSIYIYIYIFFFAVFSIENMQSIVQGIDSDARFVHTNGHTREDIC